MDLKDRNGFVMMSDTDLSHLHEIKMLFKQYRNTVAVMFKLAKEEKPITNLMSKMWRISDEILIEINKIGGCEDASMVSKDNGVVRR